MRSFSNIMPNFAAYLHLLVDSIAKLHFQSFSKKIAIKFGTIIIGLYFCKCEQTIYFHN